MSTQHIGGRSRRLRHFWYCTLKASLDTWVIISASRVCKILSYMGIWSLKLHVQWRFHEALVVVLEVEEQVPPLHQPLGEHRVASTSLSLEDTWKPRRFSEIWFLTRISTEQKIEDTLLVSVCILASIWQIQDGSYSSRTKKRATNTFLSLKYCFCS